MDCSSRRRKGSFSGEDELRKMSRVWMQDPQGMNLQHQLVVSASEQQQQMLHRLQQQQQQHQLNEISSLQQQGSQAPVPGGPLSLQQRALAAIALQEIRSSIDPVKHHASSNLIVSQQQQQQQSQAQAQAQAQLFQKYHHLVQHQLKPAANLQQANSPMVLDNRFSLGQLPVNQIPLVIQQSTVQPPSIALPNLVETDPKVLPASPQLLNIPQVMFPPSLASSPTPAASTPMRSPPVVASVAPAPATVSAPSKLNPAPGDHFQTHMPLCPNLSSSMSHQDFQQQAKSTWFTSSPASTTSASTGGMFCHSGEFIGASANHHHHHHGVQNVLEEQQQQHSMSPCLEPGLDPVNSPQVPGPGSYSGMCATSGGMAPMSPLVKQISSANLMAPPPPVYNQAPANNITNNNANNNMISKSSRSTNPALADQVTNSDFKAPESCGEKLQASTAANMQSSQQQQQQQQQQGQQQQQRLAPTRTYTKVYKLGSIGRAVDVARFKNYIELRAELSRMFGLEGQLDQRNGWQLVFVDKENDLLLVGDDPWEEFVSSVRGIRILSPKEVSYYTSEERGAESG